MTHVHENKIRLVCGVSKVSGVSYDNNQLQGLFSVICVKICIVAQNCPLMLKKV